MIKNSLSKVVKVVLGALVIVGSIPNIGAIAAETNQTQEGAIGAIIKNNDASPIKVGTTTDAAVKFIEIDLASESEKVKEALSSFKASNDTTGADILKIAEDNVDTSVTILFENFKIDRATTLAPGEISGTLIFANSSRESKELSVNLTIEKLQTDNKVEIPIKEATVDKNKVVEINASVEGIKEGKVISVGQKIEVTVVGKNSLGEEVKLDESKLKYRWIAKDKDSTKSDIVGQDKELTITKELDKKIIECIVDYDDSNEGGIK